MTAATEGLYTSCECGVKTRRERERGDRGTVLYQRLRCDNDDCRRAENYPGMRGWEVTSDFCIVTGADVKLRGSYRVVIG